MIFIKKKHYILFKYPQMEELGDGFKVTIFRKVSNASEKAVNIMFDQYNREVKVYSPDKIHEIMNRKNDDSKDLFSALDNCNF